ncbi:MAG: hypothetical protein OEZ18_05010 [Candidatus Bathyarchaeota archaeon]|nr:hypothetical protein [Candidatus Bathyarchaeota archaeon]
MKFNWTVFTVALIFSFVVNALSHSYFYLGTLHLSPQTFNWLWRLITVGSFIISPLLLFASFYLIGRNIDLASDFLSVLVPLFIGSWAGQLIGRLGILWYIIVSLGWESAPSTLFGFLWVGFTMAFSFEFFVGFTALATAYIVKKR